MCKNKSTQVSRTLGLADLHLMLTIAKKTFESGASPSNNQHSGYLVHKNKPFLTRYTYCSHDFRSSRRVNVERRGSYASVCGGQMQPMINSSKFVAINTYGPIRINFLCFDGTDVMMFCMLAEHFELISILNVMTL